MSIILITGTSRLTVRRWRLHHDRLYSEHRWCSCYRGHGVRVMMMMMMVQSRRVILLMMVMMMVRMVITASFLVIIVAGSVVVALVMMMMMTMVMIIVHRSAQWRCRRRRRLRIAGKDVVNCVRTWPLQTGGSSRLMANSSVNSGRRGRWQLAWRRRPNWKRTGTKLVWRGSFEFDYSALVSGWKKETRLLPDIPRARC